jgi:hypothetical protein
MNLEMEKNTNFDIIYMFFFKNHWIWTIKMDFHLPFLGECSVHLFKSRFFKIQVAFDIYFSLWALGVK